MESWRRKRENIQTIRFYERRRILEAPPRTASGYRSYGDRDLEDLCFFRQSQELGFTLKEILQLVKLHRAVAALPRGARTRPKEFREIARVAQGRVEQVEQKLRALRIMRMRLLGMIERLERADTVRCPAAKES